VVRAGRCRNFGQKATAHVHGSDSGSGATPERWDHGGAARTPHTRAAGCAGLRGVRGFIAAAARRCGPLGGGGRPGKWAGGKHRTPRNPAKISPTDASMFQSDTPRGRCAICSPTTPPHWYPRVLALPLPPTPPEPPAVCGNPARRHAHKKARVLAALAKTGAEGLSSAT